MKLSKRDFALFIAAISAILFVPQTSGLGRRTSQDIGAARQLGHSRDSLHLLRPSVEDHRTRDRVRDGEPGRPLREALRPILLR